MKRILLALAAASTLAHAQTLIPTLPKPELRIVTQGTTGAASTIEATLDDPGRTAGQFRDGRLPVTIRVRVCNNGTFATSTNATIAAVTGTTAVETHTSTKDITFQAAAAAKATGTLTSDNTNVSNGDTVTIGGIAYTFRTTLTPQPGEVLIGGSADASLLNLIRAINRSGTPGTDYQPQTPTPPQVTAATSVTSHAFAVTAVSPGTAGNRVSTVEGSSHLSWGAATLTGGTAAAAVRFTLTDATAETVTVRVGQALVGGKAADYSTGLQVTHAP